MKNMNKKDLLILLGASTLSMLSGIVIGCIKEKIANNTYCIIDEM